MSNVRQTASSINHQAFKRFLLFYLFIYLFIYSFNHLFILCCCIRFMQKQKIHSLLFTKEKYNLEYFTEVYTLGIRITFVFPNFSDSIGGILNSRGIQISTVESRKFTCHPLISGFPTFFSTTSKS